MIVNLTRRYGIKCKTLNFLNEYRGLDLTFKAMMYCKRNNVPLDKFLSKSREVSIVRSRVEFSRHLKSEGYADKQIAGVLNRDRSTIYHYLNYYKL